MEMNNILENLPETTESEAFTTLLENGKVKIERIVSCGHTTPPESPYCQEQDEWIIVLQGSARLRVENNVLDMREGSFLFIPKKTRHWVTYTSKSPKVIWLAIHISQN